MTKKIIIGAMESDAPGDIVTLLGYAALYYYETLQSKRTATGAPTTNYYQVPSGYELIITHVIITPGSAGDSAVFGYGDNAVALGDAAPTNAVGLTTNNNLVGPTASTPERYSVCFVVPGLKYPYMRGSAAAHIMATGFLHRT